MIVDLRSDTVTKPSKEMMKAMMAAKLGDDVFGDEPTVNALQQKAAEMFGMEDSLFCPSGTMTNQLAIKVHCNPGSEVICDNFAHIYQYEGGGIAINSHSSVSTLQGNRGRITADQVATAINNPNDIHKAITRLVSVENTMNKGGGAIYDFREILNISELCRDNNLKFHLDGARLFNALVETNETPTDYGKIFDTISICLSKGLGSPVGSLLLGSKDDIRMARRHRKAMGGGWRQAGFLAAAGIYALDNNIDRLKIDHQNAKLIGGILKKQTFVKDIFPIETNIIIFELADGLNSAMFVEKMKALDILCAPFGPNLVRFVTHLDLKDYHYKQFEKQIAKLEF
jgi:threonine aldolase